MTEHRHAEVLRAIADGQEVEYWSIEAEEWVTGGYINPITSYNLKWRVKPEPPIVLNEHVYVSVTGKPTFHILYRPNVRFTFDPETKLPIKVELI
jgi:hypothetical protein